MTARNWKDVRAEVADEGLIDEDAVAKNKDDMEHEVAEHEVTFGTEPS